MPQRNYQQQAQQLPSPLKSHEVTLQGQATFMKNLEMQVSQIVNIPSTTQLGTLLSNIKVNPKEHVNTITLRSGQKLNEVKVKKKNVNTITLRSGQKLNELKVKKKTRIKSMQLKRSKVREFKNLKKMKSF